MRKLAHINCDGGLKLKIAYEIIRLHELQNSKKLNDEIFGGAVKRYAISYAQKCLQKIINEN
jgi:hypothetical protein